MELHKKYDFAGGEILLIDKPATWTSFDVVNKVKHTLKVKVGHAGTLDPMATGLLLLGTGKFTKKLTELQTQDKVYTGTITLGATTPTYDAESEPDATFDISHIDEALIRQTAQQFTGPLEQLPPIYSALKQDGVPLYKKARKGEKVEVKPRPVEIFSFEITDIALPVVAFRVHCSKGTYIRSLAFDMGKAMGAGAYLSALCRTHIGEYRLADAWNLQEFINFVQSQQSA